MQSYSGRVGAFVVEMNSGFDIIVGISYTRDCLLMPNSAADSSSHRLLCDAAHDHLRSWPIVNAGK